MLLCVVNELENTIAYDGPTSSARTGRPTVILKMARRMDEREIFFLIV